MLPRAKYLTHKREDIVKTELRVRDVSAFHRLFARQVKNELEKSELHVA